VAEPLGLLFDLAEIGELEVAEDLLGDLTPESRIAEPPEEGVEPRRGDCSDVVGEDDGVERVTG
jgi:hypothetical protein